MSLHIKITFWLNETGFCCPLHDVHRFTVRDFQYNEEEMKADKEEMTRLSTDKKKQFVSSIVFFPLMSCICSILCLLCK